MLKGPKISIVIPSFNKGKYFKKTLISIFNQNYTNFEVIIQDGGSTDNTYKVVKHFIKKYPNKISWTSKKDKGQLDAINLGLRKTSGDLLTYINADDYFYSKSTFRYFAKEFMKSSNFLWFVGKGVTVDDSGIEISSMVSCYKNLLLKLNKYPLLLMVNYMFQPSVFFSKSAYSKYGPFQGVKGIVMEYNFWLTLGKVCMPKIISHNVASFRLSKSGFSLNRFGLILKQDQKIATKFTSNKLLIFLHYLHNLFRVVTVKLFKY